MTRDEFARRLVEYIDGKLDAAEARAFREYLERDPDAAREVRRHQDVDRLLGLLPGAALPADVLDRMAERALAEAGADVSLKPLLRWVSLAAAAILVGVVWVMTPRLPEEGATSVKTSDLAARMAAGDAGAAEAGIAEALPEFLNDPEFVGHFDVIQNLSDLEEWGHLLDGGDDALFDLLALEFLEGA